MSTATKTLPQPTGTNTQQVAWGVMLIAFAIFCLLCVGTSIGVNFFLFQSTTTMQTTVRVGRGTAGITEPADPIERVERLEQSLNGSGTVVTTDAQSQATLSFRDPTADSSFVAALTLKGDTSMVLRNALRPRFEWGARGYQIDLQQFSGEIDVLVSSALPRDFRLTIRTVNDELVYITDSGRYMVHTAEAQTQVVNQAGLAAVILPDWQTSRAISPGQRAVANSELAQIEVGDGFVDLLNNSTFEETFRPELADGRMAERELPAEWGCSEWTVNEPLGTYQPDVLEGRRVLRLLRGDGATTHGETLCTQWLGPRDRGGVDVSAYDFMSLRATFNIQYQSLHACGTEASECPLMLLLNYIDVEGNAREWIHGFHAKPDPQGNYPARCSSCTIDHEIINEKAWYTYDSGNLFTQFPAEQRPVSIISLIFYASGHQYDVVVSEVSLLAGSLNSTAAVAAE